jgi:hypothetical protein
VEHLARPYVGAGDDVRHACDVVSRASSPWDLAQIQVIAMRRDSFPASVCRGVTPNRLELVALGKVLNEVGGAEPVGNCAQ